MNRNEFDSMVATLIALNNEPHKEIGWIEQTAIIDAVDFMLAARPAIERILSIVDDMGSFRKDICEEAIKAHDERIAEARSNVYTATSLEEKLERIQEQRELEKTRSQMRSRLFELIEDGGAYANDPLPRCELLALVNPLRRILSEDDSEGDTVTLYTPTPAKEASGE